MICGAGKRIGGKTVRLCYESTPSFSLFNVSLTFLLRASKVPNPFFFLFFFSLFSLLLLPAQWGHTGQIREKERVIRGPEWVKMCSVYNSSKVRWPRQSQRSEFSRGAGKHVAIAVAGLDFTAAWILSFILWRLQLAVSKVLLRHLDVYRASHIWPQNTLQIIK